jgi:hypothetical protein
VAIVLCNHKPEEAIMNKNVLVKFLAVALATMFLTACKGGDNLVSPDGVKPMGNHKVSVAGTQMTINLSFRDGVVHRLVHDNNYLEETSAAQFVAFVWTGDADKWRSTRKVLYTGDASVVIAVPTHDAGNGYFLTPAGEKYWLDLGQTDGVGCQVVLQREHNRHVIVW